MQIANVEDKAYQKSAKIGAILVGPTALFLSLVASKFLFGQNSLFYAFERFISTPERNAIFQSLSPMLFLGLTATALFINISAIATMRFEQTEKGHYTTLEFKGRRWNVIMIAISAIALVIVSTYLVRQS